MAIGKGSRITWEEQEGVVLEVVATPGGRPTATIELTDGKRLRVLTKELQEEQVKADALTQKPPRPRHKMKVGPDVTREER